jgi:hypothetical protein
MLKTLLYLNRGFKMSTISFDTLKFVKQLEASGIPPVQAEAFVNAQRDILSEAMDTTLATRADVDRIERKLIEHDAKFDKLQWMTGIVIALAIANFAKQFF